MPDKRGQPPEQRFEVENPVGKQAAHFPFYVRRFGFLAGKKFAVGQEADYGDILILYSLSGAAEFTQSREPRRLYANDLVITACHAPLRFRAAGDEKWEFFYVHLGGSHIKYHYNLIRTKDGVLRINPLSGVAGLFERFREADYTGSTLANMRLSALAHELLCELYEASLDVAEAKSLIPVQDSDVHYAINFIKTHYKDAITIDSICREIHLSKYYFCKIFKRHTGMTLHRYLNEYRVHKSKELLSYSELPVGSVAPAVGFGSALTYIRSFKKTMRMTPGEYRKNF